MRRASVPTCVGLVLLVASGCGSERSPAPPAAPPSAAAAEPPTPQPPPRPEGPLTVTADRGIVYRASDGDWVARVTVTVRNDTRRPATVERDAFFAVGLAPWERDTSLPDTTAVAPGSAVSGDIAWLGAGDGAEPVLRLQYPVSAGARARGVEVGAEARASLLLDRTVPLVAVLVPTASGRAPNAPRTASLPFTVSGPATTWLTADGSRALRVDVTITNDTDVPLRFWRDYVQANVRGPTDAHGRYGTSLAAGSTLADPIELGVGAHVSGTVAWVWSGDSGVPRQARIELGAQGHSASPQTVPVREGAAP